MNVSLEKNKLKITFDYDARIVALVGSIEGRKFNDKHKCWYAPRIQTVNTVRLLSQVGFHFSDAVLEEFKHQIIFNKKMSRLKAGEFKDVEKDMINSLNLPLYDYQKVGAAFIAGVKSGLLADQPGLGKTLQSLAGSVLLNTQKVLIFCPPSLKQTWQEEIQQWLPSSSSVIVTGTPTQRLKSWNSDVKYYICNYQLAYRDLKILKAMKWDFIIADEATVLSNRDNVTAKSIKKIPSTYKLALTGTPVSNSVDDMWSIMDWLQPGLLGDYWHFIQEYCILDKYNAVESYKNLAKFRDKIEPYVLRRLKSQVLHELPPKTHENIWVEFSPDERQLYTAIEDEIKLELRMLKMQNVNNLNKPFVKIVRLKQMACSSELVNGVPTSSKLNELKSLLKIILQEDEKTIIFTGFRTMAVILMRELAQYNPLLIAGGMSDEERTANRHAFNTNDHNKILIMTSSGNMGLNLQRASSVIHYDLPWSIAMAEQREGRAHRNGQTKNVTIYRMMVTDSIDEYILKTLYDKERQSDDVLNDTQRSMTITDIESMLH